MVQRPHDASRERPFRGFGEKVLVYGEGEIDVEVLNEGACCVADARGDVPVEFGGGVSGDCGGAGGVKAVGGEGVHVYG